jgi:hypothetical protein
LTAAAASGRGVVGKERAAGRRSASERMNFILAWLLWLLVKLSEVEVEVEIGVGLLVWLK